MIESSANVKKVSVYYLVGTLFNKGISFITVPIFTRLLSTYDYGIVNTYNSWIGILSVIMGLAIYMGIRAAFVDYPEKIDEFMSVCTTFTLLFSSIISALAIIVYYAIRPSFSFNLLCFCLIQGTCDALIQNYLMYLMMDVRYKQRTVIMVLPSLISTCLSITVITILLSDNRYWGRIVPNVFVNFVLAVIIVILIYTKNHKLYSKEYLTYALKISAPLVIHGFALNVLSQSDRTMITWLADANQTGIYSLIYNFSMIATVLITSLEGVWVPWFTKKMMGNETDAINMQAHRYINIMTVAISEVILLGPEAVRVMASQSYWEGIKIIPPIVISNFIVFSYTMFVNVEHFYKKTLYISINTFIAAIINILLNYLFIPLYGYTAAAYTTLASYIVSLLLHMIYAKRLNKNLFRFTLFKIPVLVLTVVTAFFYILQDYWFLRWIIAATIISVELYQERNTISNIVVKKSKN